MKMIEIKGLSGLVLFVLVALVLLGLTFILPVLMVLVVWNAVIGELLHGHMINLLQAALLTIAIGITFKIIFKPQLAFQIRRAKSPDDLNPPQS